MMLVLLQKEIFLPIASQYELLLPEVISSSLYFSSLTLFLYFWAKLSHVGSSRSMRFIFYAFIVGNFVLYVGASITLLHDGATAQRHPTYNVFVSTYSLLLSLCFLVYGSRIYVMFRTAYTKTLNDSLSGVRVVTSIAIVVLVLFLFRALVILTLTVWQPQSREWEVVITFFAVCEVIPIVLMLIVFGNSTRRSRGYSLLIE